MKKIIALTLITFIIPGNNIYASILGSEELKINFTDKDDAKRKATWSEPDYINITQNGLGWDGEQNASRDSWIETVPLAVGLSWRPTQSANITVEIEPEVKSITLPNGQTYTPSIGSMLPVISAAASLARKQTALATSSKVAKRCSGTLDISCSLKPGILNKGLLISVPSIQVGATALTRTLWAPHSMDVERVICTTTALVVL